MQQHKPSSQQFTTKSLVEKGTPRGKSDIPKGAREQRETLIQTGFYAMD